jgi:hypothetical protein
MATSPAATSLALHLLIRAQVMGYLPADAQGTVVLDLELLDRICANVAAAGVATRSVSLHRLRGEKMEEALRAIIEAVDRSPNPAGEWGPARQVLGDELLAGLLGISESSLRRYAGGERATPDEVAWRLHGIARMLAGLLGSFNEYGVRRWFGRPVVQLGGEPPATVIRAAESEDELEPAIAFAMSLAG